MLLAGCDVEPLSSVRALAGEVSLHQFDDGWMHAWGVFLDEGVPIESVKEGRILTLPPSPFAQFGSCEVTRAPRCSGCPDGTWCRADGECARYPEHRFRDVGSIRVGDKQLDFDGASGLYQSTPPPGPGRWFAGGETLAVDSPSWRARLRAPGPPKNVIQQLPRIGWDAEGAELMDLLLVYSSADDWTRIRCRAVDDGAFVIPDGAFAELPPRPRALHFELTRNVEEMVALAGGEGVLVHAGYTFARNATEP